MRQCQDRKPDKIYCGNELANYLDFFFVCNKGFVLLFFHQICNQIQTDDLEAIPNSRIAGRCRFN